MKKFLNNIKKYNCYAKRAAKAELKSEVEGSYLNWLWWIIEPLSFMLIYNFVFGYVFKNNQKYFASFIFIGLLVWEFFNRMIIGSIKLIANNRNLVTKVYIPKYILLLSKSYTYLFKMGISFSISIILMVIQQVPFTMKILYVFPIVAVIYVLSFGIGMILMHFGVYVSDLSNVTNIVMKMVFYLSGVFYNIRKRLDGSLRFFLLRANPIAFCMDELRKVMIDGRNPSYEGLIFWFFIGIVLCMIGINLIHKNENSYAKVI